MEGVFIIPATKAQQRAVAKYMAANYDEMKIRVPKGRKADIEAHAKTKGNSINGLVSDLIRTDMGMTETDWKRAPVEDE